ncbi:MAG: hypothetical protein KJP07_08395 [Desulfatitalea sp.]|nr:hypothetical protein [Desulfatitalea sp.]
MRNKLAIPALTLNGYSIKVAAYDILQRLPSLHCHSFKGVFAPASVSGNIDPNLNEPQPRGPHGTIPLVLSIQQKEVPAWYLSQLPLPSL